MYKMGKNKDYREGSVSIIMPAYNSEDFIIETIQSVIKQTYENWELLIIDDCSTDRTQEIIKDFAESDKRVKYHRLTENSGAATARNTAIDLAQGKYLAFLDSDDLWYPQKLDKQINFMEANGYDFTCTNYTKIDENSSFLDKTITAHKKLDYDGLLKECPGNSTVIYNADKIGKVRIPKIRKRNDYVMWLKVLKNCDYLYGMDEVLSCHRIRKGSLSKNKFALVKYHWKIYRNIEKLGILKSSYLIVYWVLKTVFK